MKSIIRNAFVVNENKIQNLDVLINNERIEKIAPVINIKNSSKYAEIDAEGLYLIPGMIDAHVHFREPGLNYKGDILSETKAALAGGVTSFLDMPNTIPHATSLNILEHKYKIASTKSLLNYSFFFGVNKNNIEEALRIDNQNICGITDDGLYFSNPHDGILANDLNTIEKLFSASNSLIALHSEDNETINQNFEKYKGLLKPSFNAMVHTKIRDQKACYISTKRIIEKAKKWDTRLHVLHVTTKLESDLFENEINIRNKKITSEVCVQNLYLNSRNYDEIGNKMIWNPSIKNVSDQKALLKNVLNNKIDLVVTDHSPHLLSEKNGHYLDVKPGAPMVQHSLPILFDMYAKGKISIEKIVEKTSHHVADCYKIQNRGYIREGYYADIAIIDIDKITTVNKSNILYKCGWSPIEQHKLRCAVNMTIVNGVIKFMKDSFINHDIKGHRLKFF